MMMTMLMMMSLPTSSSPFSTLNQPLNSELLREIIKRCELKQKKGFTLFLQNSQVFLEESKQIEKRRRSEEIGTEMVNLYKFDNLRQEVQW